MKTRHTHYKGKLYEYKYKPNQKYKRGIPFWIPACFIVVGLTLGFFLNEYGSNKLPTETVLGRLFK